MSESARKRKIETKAHSLFGNFSIIDGKWIKKIELGVSSTYQYSIISLKHTTQHNRGVYIEFDNVLVETRFHVLFLRILTN